jgi:dTDP-4-amino-4,6-dideoxygalactose transaminase
MMEPLEKPIFVTKPFMPRLEEFCEGLSEIWENRWLTNNGPVLKRFTRELSNYFQVEKVCLFNNGTLALQIALQGMEISGDVITTPFTFVATTHALYWNKLRPVFADIESKYYTLDPEKVEEAITPWTTAILAVHVYGHPCNLNALAEIARKHNLKLIYDAAHAFGVRVGKKSIAHFGDMSMFSFHATKLYHSIEGGMLIFKDAGLTKKLDYLKNFGFENEVEVIMPGTNAKMNEFQALMGELVLLHIDEIISKRKKLYERYRELIQDVPGIKLVPPLPKDVEYNYAFMPIEVDKNEYGLSRDALYEKLKEYNVFTRRYFYPIISDYPCYRRISTNDSLSMARAVASRILTLPLYFDLEVDDVERICELIYEGRCGSRQEVGRTLFDLAPQPNPQI